MQHRKGDPVPLGWGVDKDGRATTSPAAILDGGGLSPLGCDNNKGLCFTKLNGMCVFVCVCVCVCVCVVCVCACAFGLCSGSIDTAGYKGYGFGMIVELFCAVLSGALASPDIGACLFFIRFVASLLALS